MAKRIVRITCFFSNGDMVEYTEGSYSITAIKRLLTGEFKVEYKSGSCTLIPPFQLRQVEIKYG